MTDLLAQNLFAALAAAVLAMTPTPPPAATPDPSVVIVANDGTFSFAERIAFRLEVRSDAPVRDVVLRFTIGDGEVINRRVPEFEPGTRVVARHEEPSPRGAIPPTSEIRWWWDIATADGRQIQTERRTLRYLDQRYSWTSRDVAGVRLWSYSLEDKDAEALAESAVASLRTIRERVGLAVEQPVNVVAYASQADLRPSLLGRGDVYEARLATLGARVADDVVVLDAGSRSVALETVLRHELSHVAVHLRMDETWIDVPSWLDEGLAMYLEGGFGTLERRALDRAIRDDTVMSLRSMTSFPGDADQVTLAYAQSRDVIAYLVDTHGRAKLTALFDTVAPGDRTIDEALTEVYGFDQLGLYQAYRRERGLSPAATPLPDAVPPGLVQPARIRASRPSDDESSVPAPQLQRAGRWWWFVLPAAAALVGLVGLALLVVRPGRRPPRQRAPQTAPQTDDPGAAERSPSTTPPQPEVPASIERPSE